ncbi:MAG: RNA polymerase sigma factor [Alphaproteobacteria bacterium]
MLDRFGQQLPRYIPEMRRYARVLLGSSTEVDDLVQETLCHALRKRHVWDSVRNIKAYLFTMLHNLHLDRAGMVSRRGRQVPMEDVEWHLQCPEQQPDPIVLRDLERGLMDLRQDQRQVVIMIGVEGMSYRDVAKSLDIPIGTVMSRLSRGREALRKSMEGSVDPNIHLAR